MELTIIRDDDLPPGCERRFVTADRIVWVCSAQGVSEVGARAFEACTKYMTEKYGWGDQVPTGGRYVYRQDPGLPPNIPVRMIYEGGVFVTLLHPAHFALATINSACVELRQTLQPDLAPA